jgi:thiol-disulfide isomerase/thioredoxin
VVVVAVCVALFVGVLALAITQGGDDHPGSTEPTSWDLPRLEGRGRVRLDRFRGEPTVVNFFASWCRACDDELPEMRRAAEALEGRVNFVFVDSNESGDPGPMVARNHLDRYALARDIGGTHPSGNGLYRNLGANGGMPITAFYDRQGHLIETAYGALLGDALARMLERLYGVDLTAN